MSERPVRDTTCTTSGSSMSVALDERRGAAAYPPLATPAEFGREACAWLAQFLTLHAHGDDLAPGRSWLAGGNLREVGMIHPGIVVAVAAVMGVVRRHPLRLPLLLLSSFGLAVTLRVPGFYELLIELPGFRENANQRLAGLVAFGAALLAGIGIDRLEGRRWRVASVAAPTALVLLAAIAWIDHVKTPPLTPGHHAQFGETLLVVPPLAALALGCVCTLVRGRRMRLAGLCLLIVCAVDVARHVRPLVPWAPAAATWPTTPLVDHLKGSTDVASGRILCIGESFPAEMNLAHELPFLDGYCSLQSRDESTFLALAGVPVTPSGKVAGAWAEPAAFDDALLDLASVRHVVVTPRPPGTEGQETGTIVTRPDGRRFRLAYVGVDGLVLERLEALPRARLCGTAVAASDHPDVAAFVANEDERTTVMVEGDARPTGGTGRAELVEYSADCVRIRAEVAGGSAILVTSDVFDEHWSVTVDGSPRETVRVNHHFRGVLLEEGERDVVFHHEPGASFTAGLAHGGVASLLWILLVLKARDERGAEVSRSSA